MKLSRVAMIVGGFFLSMQFSTVFIFNQMLTISKEQGLATEELARLQITIMNVVLCTLIASGILFVILLMATIYRTIRQPLQLPENA